jgi:hypothetical protein
LSVDKRFGLTFDWYKHFFKNKSYMKTKTLEQINEVEKILFSR